MFLKAIGLLCLVLDPGFICIFVLSALCVCTMYMHGICGGQKRASASPGTGVVGACESPRGH